jgi:hypothetical protein
MQELSGRKVMQFRNMTTYAVRRVKVFNPNSSNTARQRDNIAFGTNVDFDLAPGTYTVEVYTSSDTAPAARITGVNYTQVVRCQGGIGAPPKLSAVDPQQQYG